MNTYLGFSGFTCAEPIATLVSSLPKQVKRRFMVGIHAHFSTLLYQTPPPTFPFDYPHADRIKELFPNDQRCFNLIRYASEHEETTLQQLIALSSVGGQNLTAVQIDMHWPDPAQLVMPNMVPGKLPTRLILGIDDTALGTVGHEPRKLARQLDRYQGAVHGFMITSKTADTNHLKRMLAACASRSLIQPGCAIDAKEVPQLLRTFFDEFPQLNIEVLFPPRSTLSPRADPVQQFFAAAREQDLW